MLKVQDVSVSYDGMKALDRVSLQIKEGEFVSLIGPNGAGKSSLLKSISGIKRVDKGTISFMGEPVHSLSPQALVERGIIHVPEGRRIFPTLTVLENLDIGSYGKRAKVQRQATLRKVFDLFDVLDRKKHQRGGSLSGGEQQMLAIGRGLMGLPKILMLDEPSGGLSPKMVHKTFQAIQDINKEGVTILLVEQNVMESLSMCSRGYVLENGRIFSEGTGRELLNDAKINKAYLGL